MSRFMNWAVRNWSSTGVYIGFMIATALSLIILISALIYLAVFKSQYWAWIPIFIFEVFSIKEIFQERKS